MICSNCRKQNNDTKWEKLGKFLMKYVFPTIYEDIRADLFTKGISEGYKLGFDQGIDIGKRNPLYGIDTKELMEIRMEYDDCYVTVNQNTIKEKYEEAKNETD